MAIDPNLVNLATISELSSATGQTLDWYLIIENPATQLPFKITSQDFATLLNGGVIPPNGVLTGLNITINNASTPKTATVNAGLWRIDGVIYTANSVSNFNINTADSTFDRIDAFYADNSGIIGYVVGTPAAGPVQPNIPADSIRIANIVVVAGGGTIATPTVASVNYALMNALNQGDLDITGNYKVNGVPIGGGASSVVLPFDETDLVNETSGGVDYWYIPLTLSTLGTKRPYYIEVNDVQSQVTYDGSLGRLIGFDDDSISQTINVYTI